MIFQIADTEHDKKARTTTQDIKVYLTLEKRGNRLYFQHTNIEATSNVPYTGKDEDVKFIDMLNWHICFTLTATKNDWIKCKTNPHGFTHFHERDKYVTAEGIVPKGTSYYVNYGLTDYLVKSVRITKVNY